MRALLLLLLLVPVSGLAQGPAVDMDERARERERSRLLAERRASPEWTWKPKVRKSIPAIPGHSREIFTVRPSFLDTLKAMDKAGWPTIDWGKQ